MKLGDIADIVTERISSDTINIEDYVTTDCMLQNKCGREIAANLPPQSCSLTHFVEGDVLIANIRPYLKKIWLADAEGGASNDVIVFRARKGHSSSFLYAVLMQDSFFDFAMLGAKGSKMPRGDKDQMLRFDVLQTDDEEEIGEIVSSIESKIALNRSINHNLEALAKQLYDYWFVQFDFPDDNGRPYKSSGGKMVWNEKLKREIPEGWKVESIFTALDIQYGFPFSTELFNDEGEGVPVVRIRDIIDNTISAYSTEKVDERYHLAKGDLLIGMDGNFHMNVWADNNAYLNQRSVRIRGLANSAVSVLQAKFSLSPYIKAKEQRAKGSTVGHLSDKDLKELYILVPSSTLLREILDNILSEIIANRENILSLTKQRDELLPLLMNGQVSVNYDLSPC